MYYYTLMGDENGYIFAKLEAESVYIVPNDKVEPYYTEVYRQYDIVHPQNFMFGTLLKPIETIYDLWELCRKELHLPSNYIQKSYEIDLR